MITLRMKSYNMILAEKLQKYQLYYLEKLKKHEYLTGEEIFSSDQSRIIEQTRFTYSHLDKEFGKQIKTIDEQGEKQMKALEEHWKQLVKSNDEKDSLIHSK